MRKSGVNSLCASFLCFSQLFHHGSVYGSVYKITDSGVPKVEAIAIRCMSHENDLRRL